MKRRSFLRASFATLGTAAAAAATADAAEPTAGELYELRAYSLAAAKQPVLDKYLGQAFIPTLKRYGIGPVGAFVEQAGPGQVKVYVLIVYPSPDHVATLSARLAADEDYRKAA